MPAKDDFVDYYSILGVKHDASLSEIKKCYRKIALAKHPDRNPDDPNADFIFAQIVEAKDTLFDDEKRAKFDLEYKEYLKEQQRIAKQKQKWNLLDAQRRQNIEKLEKREKDGSSASSASNASSINTHNTFIRDKNRAKKLVKEELDRVRKLMEEAKLADKMKENKSRRKLNQQLKDEIENEILFTYYFKNYRIILKSLDKKDSSTRKEDDIKIIFDHFCKKNYSVFTGVMVDEKDSELAQDRMTQEMQQNEGLTLDFDLKDAISRNRRGKNGTIVLCRKEKDTGKWTIVFDNIVAVYETLNDRKDLENGFGFKVKFSGNEHKLHQINQMMRWYKFKKQMKKEQHTHDAYIDFTKQRIQKMFS